MEARDFYIHKHGKDTPFLASEHIIQIMEQYYAHRISQDAKSMPGNNFSEEVRFKMHKPATPVC